MTSWVKWSQAYGTEWIILIERPYSAIPSSLETKNRHNYAFGNSLLFSSHIAPNTPKSRSNMKCLQFPPAFQERGTASVFPMVCFLFVWLVWVYFLCFIISRVFKSSGSCGGLYKCDDRECSSGDGLLPQLLFLVCDCQTILYSLLLPGPGEPSAKRLLANESACPHWLSGV